jgi:hypothetical protein
VGFCSVNESAEELFDVAKQHVFIGKSGECCNRANRIYGEREAFFCLFSFTVAAPLAKSTVPTFGLRLVKKGVPGIGD